MATLNPFGLLGDDDVEDPSLLLTAHQKAAAAASVPGQPKKAPAQAQHSAKSSGNLPSKPLHPSQAVSESRNEGQRGGRGVGRGGFRGRGGRGVNREVVDNEDTFGISNGFSGGYRPYEDGDGGRDPSERRSYGGPRDGGGGFRGGRGGGFNNGEGADGERPRRAFERHSRTGRGTEFKREGAGRGNWGTPTDEITSETEEAANEVKNVDSEKESGQDDVGDANKDVFANEQEAKPEEKEMTLEDYEKVLEEKRKALLALKSEERKVNLDKELEAMQLLSNKKNDDEVFIKLGSGKDKRKEAVEKAKKSVSINEFLKPAEGKNYYGGGGHVKGRQNVGGNNYNSSRAAAIAIGDAGQFPSLGGK